MTRSKTKINLVWTKGREILGTDRRVWRKDHRGNTIKREDYGNLRSAYGWKFNHIRPPFRGGSDTLSNLRPIHCTAIME